MLLQCRREKESGYVGSAPDRRPSIDRAEWFFCSDGVFPRRRTVVTRAAAGRKGEYQGARRRSAPWRFAPRRFGRAAGHHAYQPGDRRAWRSHVCKNVSGDLAPQFGSAERVALLVALPFHWFLNTFHWAIHLLDGISSAIVKALGVTSAQVHGVAHSTEELQIQIQQARERGVIAPGEEKFILSAMELAQIQVREIMVPRPDIHTLPVESSLDEVMRVFATTQRSRIPVYRGTADHILGFVHIKDMIWILLDRERRLEENLSPPPFDLRRVLREVLIVPETKPASELLLELRTRHVGMALVVDEFGSILGLVTMEDILEQMVGEIHDEFDVVERPLTLADGALIFDAALNVRDLDTQYNITLPDDPAYATVGGFVLDQLGFIPKGGESFEYGNFRFSVVEMDGKRVARVKIQRIRPTENESRTHGSPDAVLQPSSDSKTSRENS